jgi:transposase
MTTKQKRMMIEQLTRAGKRQAAIARLLGMHRNSIYLAQRELGLSAWQRPSPEVEAQIISLLRSGLGTGKVCRQLGVTEHFVRLTARKNRFHRKPGEVGYRSQLSPAKRQRILEEITQRRNFGTHLASKYKVPYKLILKLAHETLACPRFRAGYASPFLSNFPQRHFRKVKGA